MADPAQLAFRLSTWYREHARSLPFRLTRDPYRIWISEVMLQQTRVAAMLPAYERFMERFPDVQSLALAEEEEVLRLWQGLGYYSRARNLHRAARTVCQSHDGETCDARRAVRPFPDSYEALRSLPGIGPYTAAAVSSICRDEPVAVVDGNVRRVLGRLHGHETADVRTMEGLATDFLVRGGLLPSLHNQAMMEVGALVCLPRTPRCNDCPLSSACRFRPGAGSAMPKPAKSQAAGEKVPLSVEIQLHLAPRAGSDRMMLLITPNTESLFLKNQMFFPHRISSGGAEVLRTAGFRSTSRPAGSTFRHAIMNWKIQAVVQIVPHSQPRQLVPGGQWILLGEARERLFSSLALKSLERATTFEGAGLPVREIPRRRRDARGAETAQVE